MNFFYQNKKAIIFLVGLFHFMKIVGQNKTADSLYYNFLILKNKEQQFYKGPELVYFLGSLKIS